MSRENIDRSWVDNVHSELELTNLPLITLGVLSYNRKEDLRGTLDVLTAGIWYPRIEIIVIDNGSKDDSMEMVRSLFPEVQIVELSENVGIAARNNLFKRANGKYIFSFDDDSFPAGPFTIINAVRYLERNPRIAVLCMQCFQPRSNFCETSDLEKFASSTPEAGVYEGVYFAEGAMCFRTEMLRDISGYDPEFHWGAEGADLSLELYKQNLSGVYYPELMCLHMRSPLNRDVKTSAFLFTRNYVWTIIKHFPVWAAPIVLTGYILRRLIVCITHPVQATGVLRGIAAGLGGFLHQRKKTSKFSMGQLIRLKRWYFFLIRW